MQNSSFLILLSFYWLIIYCSHRSIGGGGGFPICISHTEMPSSAVIEQTDSYSYNIILCH